MLICPQCRTPYPAGVGHCTQDGFELIVDETADVPDPLIGRTIADRFIIDDRIGLGGMGTVYCATQIGLNRPVALKILKPEVSLKKDAVTRFHREAKAMSLLGHPNTVRVFDFGETGDGLLYLAMELLEGEVLTQKSAREGEVDVVEAIRIIQQVLASLHEAHTKGLIHRDLKPDNIFLAHVEGHPEPVVKVLDFGIAKAWQGEGKLDQFETQAGTVFGTPRYMSPEQAQGHALDPRSDLYGVGILLYQLLAGHPPFTDQDAVVVMAKHIREEPEPVLRVVPERPIPPRLEAVVMRALVKDRERRFQTAEEFIAELEACVPESLALAQGEPAPSPEQGVPRLAVAIAAGILLGACALGAWVLVGSDPPPAEHSPSTAALAPAKPPSAPVHAGGPPATSSRLEAHLDSNPPGAEVWRGEERLGTTPLTRTLAEHERYHVELRLEGYEPARTELVAGERASVKLTTTATEAAPRRAQPRRRALRRARTADERPVTSPGAQEPVSAPAPERSKPSEPYERFDRF